MTKTRSASVFLALMITSAGMSIAQTAGQDIKHAGTETKEATKDTGHAIAHGAKTGARKTKNGTKTAARKTKNGTKKVVHGAAHGTRKGAEKVEGKTAPSQ